jgi:hypothetical protein
MQAAAAAAAAAAAVIDDDGAANLSTMGHTRPGLPLLPQLGFVLGQPPPPHPARGVECKVRRHRPTGLLQHLRDADANK